MATSHRPRYTMHSAHAPASQGRVTSDHDNVEDLSNYGPGGYRPTVIGDVLSSTSTNNRYIIVHKLGFGPSSTVWCAKRESDGSFFALKIHRASLSDEYFENKVSGFMRPKEGLSSLIRIEESFFENWSKGQRHWCLVLPLLGPSLFDPRVDSALRPEARQTICEELTGAVFLLNSCRNICHSNLSPSHVLVRLPGISPLPNKPPTDEGRILKLLGPVERSVASSNDIGGDHQPPYLVKPASFATLPFSSIWSVAIVSFTNAFTLSAQPVSTLQCPSSITPPEILALDRCLLDEKVDIWQLGCLMFRLHTGIFPFGSPDSLGKLATNIKHFAPTFLPESAELRKDLATYEKEHHQTLFPAEGVDSGRHHDPAGPSKAIDERFIELQRDRLSVRHTKYMADLLSKILLWNPSLRLRLDIALLYVKALREEMPVPPDIARVTAIFQDALQQLCEQSERNEHLPRSDLTALSEPAPPPAYPARPPTPPPAYPTSCRPVHPPSPRSSRPPATSAPRIPYQHLTFEDDDYEAPRSSGSYRLGCDDEPHAAYGGRRAAEAAPMMGRIMGTEGSRFDRRAGYWRGQ